MLNRIVSVLLFTVFCSPSTVFADTVRMKNGKEAKGIVVEDYVNRIVLSTPDGEQSIMKDEIAELYYDSEDENLVKLADRARERRDYARAYDAYAKALKLNPGSKVAQDGLIFTQGFLLRKDESKKEDDIRRREEFERYGAIGGPSVSDAKGSDDLATRLNKSLGLTLVIQDGFPMVATIQQNSPVYRAGVRSGDFLAAVWSRLTGYMSLQEIMDVLVEKSSSEIKATIERTVAVPVSGRRGLFAGVGDLIGATLTFRFDGLTVTEIRDGGAAALAGLRKGDLVTAIDGQPTRYMPLKKVVEAIRTAKGDSVKITFRREVTIWRQSAL